MNQSTFVIIGTPRTKKNSPRIVRTRTGRPVLLPSEAHEAWFQGALPQARMMRVMHFGEPTTEPVNVAVTICRARATGDLNNYLAAVGDLLERSGFVANDRLIVSWDRSRLAVDPLRPRIEFVITPAKGAQ